MMSRNRELQIEVELDALMRELESLPALPALPPERRKPKRPQARKVAPWAPPLLLDFPED